MKVNSQTKAQFYKRLVSPKFGLGYVICQAQYKIKIWPCIEQLLIMSRWLQPDPAREVVTIVI